MNSRWNSFGEPNLDPSIEAAARRVLDSLDNLDTARIRVENMDVHAIMSQRSPVDEGLMHDLAATPYASPELQNYAERVRNGECRWCDIELHRPVPPEVTELKNSPTFVWMWFPEVPATQQSTPPPSATWHHYDDDDEDQMPDSWLE